VAVAAMSAMSQVGLLVVSSQTSRVCPGRIAAPAAPTSATPRQE